MRKLAFIVLAILLAQVGFSQSVMISQYIETNSGTTPKGIEIFNNSGSAITFSAGNSLDIYQGTNGAACASKVSVTAGTLAAGEVWVIGTSDLITYATTNGTNLSGTTTYGFTFNGDDALEVYLGGVLQDVFGTCGVDPGSAWTGGGVSTANNNIQINSGICVGTTTYWSDPSTRFNTVAGGTVMTGFGDSPASCVTTCTAPTTQPSNISFSSVTSTGMTVSWTNSGDGDSQIVLVHEGSAVNSTPASGTAYTADNSWTGTPDQIGTGNYVMYTGNGGPVSLTNLNPNTTYYISIFEYNSVDNCYYLTSPLTGNQTTLCDDPTAQPTSVTFANVASTSMDINWVGGNGSNSLVVISAGSAVAGTPNDGTSYTANTVFGSGNQIAAGEYVVYNGTGSTVSVTGLTPQTTYYVSIFEFNSGSSCYYTTSPATNNQTMPCPSPPDNVSGFSVTPGNASASITWTNPAYCFDEVLIVAEDGTIGFTPSGDGSTITANPVYGNGTCVNCTGSNNEYAVYKGTGTSATITGLTNGTSYCFKVWTRNGTDWSLQDVVCSIVPQNTIPDNGCSTSSYATMTFNYTGTNPIADINVDVFIEHPYRGDVNVDVISPLGTIVTIFNGQGTTADNLEATFDDASANTTYTTNHVLDGVVDETLQPSGGTLATFNGEVPTGTWTIRVCDDAAADVGVLNNWNITIVESCTPTHTVTGFAPTTGPVGTAVTITGTGFTTSTTVSIDGIAATVQYVSSTTIIAEMPSGATDNTIDVNEGGCDVSTASNFTFISTAGLCGGSSNFTDLIISEVYDSDAGNVWYIELFNPTGSAIDLAAENYTIDRYGTAWSSGVSRTITLSGVVPAGGVYLLQLGDSPDNCPNSWDFSDPNAGINADDGIMLVHNGTDVDAVVCPNNTGYSILRDITATGPTATYNAADWTTNSVESCGDLGSFGLVYDTHPSVTSQPSDVFACTLTMSITATAGSGGGALTYQWYYNDGSSASWSTVTGAAFPAATVAGETTINLSITGTPTNMELYDGYQFYCLVTESGSCSTASNAAQFRARSENDPEMITAMINSCDGVCGTEGYNEFIALETGSAAIDVTSPNISVMYNTTYPATTDYTQSYTADAGLTSQFNVASGCGSTLFYDAVGTGTIPANSTVLVMSSNVCPTAYDFTSLCGSGPIYLLYSTDGSWGSTGNFANTGSGSRYFSVTFTDVNGLVTTTEYNYDPSNLTLSDNGDYVEFEYCSAPAYNYGNDGCAVRAQTLPVELLFFDATKVENTVNLNWETGSEINNDKFVVMRSKDGEFFQPIGEVAGQGNSSVINQYNFVDQHPQLGDNYYMLYQYDYNGELTKSDIRLIEFTLDEGFTTTSNDNLLQINYKNMPRDAYFEIYTIEGKLVAQEKVASMDGIITLDLPTEQQYLVRLISNNNSIVKKIIH